jgi:hypothetical protein
MEKVLWFFFSKKNILPYVAASSSSSPSQGSYRRHRATDVA